MGRKRLPPLIDQIRKAIDESDVSRYRIAQQTGISESALSQFYNGHRGLSMDSLNKLGAYLKLRVVVDPDAKQGR